MMTSMKLWQKEQAIKLRRKGKTYNEILKAVAVSKSTLSLWLSNVKLSKANKARIVRLIGLGRLVAASNKKCARIERTKNIIDNAKKEFQRFFKNPLFIAGLALYWAEGDKHRAERVKFTNSDPDLIKFMMSWFRRICNVPESKFRIALHVHDLHMRSEIQRYWSDIVNIPLPQFQKLYVKQSTLRQRRNVLYNGTCGIVVCNKNLFRRILGWKQAFIAQFISTPRSSMDRTEDF